jgi:hypothetical protein
MPLFCVFKFSSAKVSYLLSKVVLLVTRASGHCWTSLLCVQLFKRLQTRLI